MEVGMLMAMGSLNVMELLKVVMLVLPLVCGVFCPPLALLWNYYNSCGIIKQFGLKNCEVCKSFSVSPMKAYKRPMHECIG
jgi:hypothetical protein